MISGIGIDIVKIERINELLLKWGDRFKNRVFSENEIEYSENHNKSGQHFAGNFAVKEAFAKAIGTGFGEYIRINDIEVLRDQFGKPFINLRGKAKKHVHNMEISGMYTSISHDWEYSVAVVVLEK